MGWNLWNLGVNFLAMGGTLLVYDGLPAFLSKTAFWDIMDRYKVAFAFLPTSIIDTLEKEDMVPGKENVYPYACVHVPMYSFDLCVYISMSYLCMYIQDVS